LCKRELIRRSLKTSAYYRQDPILGWQPNSNVRGTHNQPGSFSTTFQTNTLGLRDRDYPLEKSAATRVVVLGDSFTWGWGVNDDEIYTERLEALLLNTEVINLGVTAYSTGQELDYFKLKGVPYRPDIVLLAFCLNDFEEVENWRSWLEKTRSGNAMVQLTNKEMGPSFRTWMAEHFYLYRFIIDRINTSKPLVNFLVKIGLKSELSGYEALDTNLRPALKNYTPEFVQHLERTKGYLRVLRDEVRSLQARFIIVLVPSLQAVEDVAFHHAIAYTTYEPEDFDLWKPYRLVEAFAEEEHIEIINPLPSFLTAGSNGEKLYLKNDMHFTPRGHEVFAGEIYKYLTSHSSSELTTLSDRR